MKNNNVPMPPVPHMPPPIEQFRISKEEATNKTKEARQELFEKEKGKTYYKIYSEAEKGNYYLSYKYPENCNRKDIEDFQNELIEKGFKVKLESGIYGDTLCISWYHDK